VISWLDPAFGVGIFATGPPDAPLASENDKPAAPNTGRALLLRFRFEACFARDIAATSTLPGNVQTARLRKQSATIVPGSIGGPAAFWRSAIRLRRLFLWRARRDSNSRPSDSKFEDEPLFLKPNKVL
jgi:hypothetical protein